MKKISLRDYFKINKLKIILVMLFFYTSMIFSYFFIQNQIEKNNSIKIISQSIKNQINRIIPSFILPEQKEGINLILNEIVVNENLSYAGIEKKIIDQTNDCKKNDGYYICSSIFKNEVKIYIPIKFMTTFYGYLLKKKTIDGLFSKSNVERKLFLFFMTFVILLLCLSFFFLFQTYKEIPEEVDKLFLVIKASIENKENKNNIFKFYEFSNTSNMINEIILKNSKLEKEIVSNEIACQISHDIRSPLAALNMAIGTLENIPEEKRIIIRSATNRISDIANQLLKKEKNELKIPNEKLSIELLPALIDLILTEKRIQYRDMPNLIINSEFDSSYGSFAKINSLDLKRVISNLINNSIEALDQEFGRISVSIKNENKIIVSIIDNGKGIPIHILNRLGQVGITHGKSGTESGSGLGIYHAKKTIETFGAEFQVLSQEGLGTEIRMIFPPCETPSWFVHSLKISEMQSVIALDDDVSILEIWKQRFNKNKKNSLYTFTSAKEFEIFVLSNPLIIEHSLFLMDFELLGQNTTGLDLIENLNLSEKSILVTSRYEEIKIRDRCDKLNVKQIPKAMAPLVPIIFTD